MVLEAVMMCIDNSDWMRNGDYSPTRFEAQSETVSYVANAVIQGNQETTVGFLSMAGSRVEVHVSPGRSIGTIMTCLKKNVKLGGQSSFVTGLKIAQLALKNRQNKKQRQRVIMFVGSPVEETKEELVKLGKNFKKNNVVIDIVHFGDENAVNDNTEKLEALVNAVNNKDNSHLVSIPPGPHTLSDLVMSSPIMVEASAAGAAVAAGAGVSAGMADAHTVDENVDPELAMALRMSMEEERQRQERSGAAAAPAATPAPVAATPAATRAAPAPVVAADDNKMEDEDEDEQLMLAQAIAMSMQQEDAENEEGETAQSSAPAPMKDEDDEDDEDISDALKDPAFINSLLESVEGVDKDDIALDVNSILAELGGGGDNDEKKKKKKDEKKK